MAQDKPVALVTGAAHRIGSAIAADLAKHGFAVAIHHRSDGDEAGRLCSQITARGGDAVPIHADLENDEDVRRLPEETKAALGPVSLLVNNASVFADDGVEAFDRATWDTHFAVHLRAPAILAEQMARSLADGQRGLIVNIIDQRVLNLTPRFFSYTLSKSALWTATRTMAQALAPRIRVNAIGPGPTLPSPRQAPADFQKQVDSLPLKCGPKLDEFGETIRYFWKTPSVTGQMIALDGGQHLAWETPDVTEIRE